MFFIEIPQNIEEPVQPMNCYDIFERTMIHVFSGLHIRLTLPDNVTMDEDGQETNSAHKIDARPKSGTGSLRGVKSTFSQYRIGPKQQHTLRGTLQNWLVKPRKPLGRAEAQDVDMVGVDSSRCSAAAERMDTEEERAPAHDDALDSGEDTQPLTPQSLEMDNATARAPSSSSEAPRRPSKTEAEGESSRSKPKITDFFPITQSPDVPSRRRRQQHSGAVSPEQDGSAPEDEQDVAWLGTPISELRRMPECGGRLPRLRACPVQHTVMIRVWSNWFLFQTFTHFVSGL